MDGHVQRRDADLDGLALALDVIRSDRLARPAVLLVSDLDDDTGDLERVGQVAIAYRRAGIPLHVVGLDAAPEDVAFIRRFCPGRLVRAGGAPVRARLGSSARAIRCSSSRRSSSRSALAAFSSSTEPLRWRAA